MEIVRAFESYIEENKLFSKNDKILVAVSGGRDSMLLLWLLHTSHYTVHIAHCNFHLRGEESDGDQQLVEDFACKYGIDLHVKHFDTTAYAQENKVSIQIAARELRYKWFEELRCSLGCHVTAVAQHLNDSVETVLFNLSRGTGLQGLQGILAKRVDSRIIRPLLFLKNEQITELVNRYEIPYRDDSSNFSNKYARNKIRLDIIPEFEKLNPDFISIMQANMQRFASSQSVLNKYIDQLRTQIFHQKDTDSWLIDTKQLEKLTIEEWYFLFEDYGFTMQILMDLKDSLYKHSGKQFHSPTHIIVTDRERLVLSKITQNLESIDFLLDDSVVEWGDIQLTYSLQENWTIIPGNHIAQLDFNQLIFPLKIRCWQQGDSFQPLGMKGRKKVSDYFIQKKINILDKHKIPILVNGDGSIIWIVGYHMDERFKIRDNTEKVLKLVSNFKAV